MSDSVELPTGEWVPIQDTVCECNHWHEEHYGECGAPDCKCVGFLADPEASTAGAIANRGGDPEMWPEHVRRAEGAAT